MSNKSNKEYLEILYNNEKTRTLFELTKSSFFKIIEPTELFNESTFTMLSSTVKVLYCVFPTPIVVRKERVYFIKIEVESNKLTYCGLHKMTADLEQNIKYAHESVMHNYIFSHDRNISAQIGNCEYI